MQDLVVMKPTTKHITNQGSHYAQYFAAKVILKLSQSISQSCGSEDVIFCKASLSWFSSDRGLFLSMSVP